MVSPGLQLVLALLLGLVAAVMVADALLHERKRTRMLRQLGSISGTSLPGREATVRLLRRTGSPSARWTDRIARLAPPLRDLEQLLEETGLAWGRATVVRAGLGLGIALGAVAALLTRSLLPSLAGAALGLAIPRLYVLHRRARRIRAFEEQLPDAIDLLSRAVRAGHAVSTGLRMVAEESEDPIAAEFRRVFEEQKYGLPFDESLLSLARRIDLVDLRVMVVAILVQREVGGNLSEVLDKISALVRTRFTLRRQLRVHTAQGRLSGYVLSLLPVAVAVMIAILDPGYIALLFKDPIGRLMLGAALTLQLFGYLWIWRILRLNI